MNNNPTHVVTGKVRLSYAHLLEPYAQNGGEAKYSVTVLVPKGDTVVKAAIDRAIAAAAEKGREKFGAGFPMQPKHSVHDGDGMRPSDGQPFGPECRGCWVFAASSKQRPSIVNDALQPILDATEIYSGMYARVGLDFFPYSSNGNKGVGIALGNIQKVADGEPLSGRATVDDDFGGGNTAPAQYPSPNTSAPWDADTASMFGL